MPNRPMWGTRPMLAAAACFGLAVADEAPGRWSGCCPSGDVMEFYNNDEWLAAVGAYTTIDFTGHVAGEIINVQYSGIGVVFTDGTDRFFHAPGGFHDDWGVDGNGNSTVVFDTPRYWIGVEHPGTLRIDLYLDGELVYENPCCFFGGGGVGFFGGVISAVPFDTAVLKDLFKFDDAEYDDLHFGPAVCPGDLDNDGVVGPPDIGFLLDTWGTDGPADLDADGITGMGDLLDLLARWGACG